MDFNEFQEMITTVRERMENPDFLNSNLEHVYEHPRNYHDHFSYLAHIATEMPDRFGPEFNDAVAALTRHYEDRIAQGEHPDKDLIRFQEQIRQVPVGWAAQRLKKTLVDELKYPYHKHFRSEHFANGISSTPHYALQVMAESVNALTRLDPDSQDTALRNTRNDLQTILNYTQSYYRERASVEQVARMLLIVEGTLPGDIPELPEEIRAFTRELTETAGSETRREQIAATLAYYRETAAAIQLITNREFTEFGELSAVLLETTEHYGSSPPETDRAHPSRLLAQHVDTREIATFRLARQNLEEGGRLSTDTELAAAFDTVDRFIDETISPTITLYNNQTLPQRIAEEQGDIRDIWAAGALEPMLPTCEGIRAAAVKSVKEKHQANKVDNRQLVNYLIALSDYEPQSPQIAIHQSRVNDWIVRSFVHSGLYPVSNAIVDIEEGLKGEAITPNAREAVLQLIYDVSAHYIDNEKLLKHRVLYTRARRSLAHLKAVAGLEGLGEMMWEMEQAVVHKAPRDAEDNAEAWYLSSDEGFITTLKAGQYKAVLKTIIDTQTGDVEAAQHVIDYINEYFGRSGTPADNADAYLNAFFEAAGAKNLLNMTMEEFLPVWWDVVERGIQLEFVQAIKDPAAAVALMQGEDCETKRYLYQFYEALDRYIEPGVMARILSAMVAEDEAPLPPDNVARLIATNHPALRSIPGIIRRIDAHSQYDGNLQPVLWDTAKWLRDEERYTSFSFTFKAIKPSEFQTIKDYLGKMFKRHPSGNIYELAEEMSTALKAMDRYDMNNHLLEGLCTDFPRIKVMENGDSHQSDLTSANCAWLTLRLEQAMEEGGDKAAAARTALPFLQKAIVHADIDPAVDENRQTLENLLQTAEGLRDIGSPAIAERKRFMENLNSGYGAAEIMAVANDHLAQAEEGTTSLDAPQLELLRILQQQLTDMVSAHDFQQGFDKHRQEAEAHVAFNHILAAEQDIPELQNIRTDEGEYAPLRDFYEMTHGGFADDIPHITEQFFIAVDAAVESGRETSPTLQRSLQTVRDHMAARFAENDRYYEEEGYKGHSHAATIDAIRAQQQRRGDGGREGRA